jgi:hypothetical protein
MNEQEINERKAAIRRKIEAATNATNAATNKLYREYNAARRRVWEQYRLSNAALKRDLDAQLDEVNRQYYAAQDSVAYEVSQLDDEVLRDKFLKEEQAWLKKLEEAESEV